MALQLYRSIWIGSLCFTSGHKLNTNHQADTPHISDDGVALHQSCEACLGMSSGGLKNDGDGDGTFWKLLINHITWIISQSAQR